MVGWIVGCALLLLVVAGTVQALRDPHFREDIKEIFDL